jgi:hypothetical protein
MDRRLSHCWLVYSNAATEKLAMCKEVYYTVSTETIIALLALVVPTEGLIESESDRE